MNERPTSRQLAEEEAIEWFLRQREPGFSAADRQALSEWLMLSPLHVEEYLEVSMTFGSIGAANHQGLDRAQLIADGLADAEPRNVIRLRSLEPQAQTGTSRNPAHRFRQRLGWLAAASVIAAVVLVAIQLMTGATSYSTARGEQRSIQLADGSVITLNADSRVRVKLRAHERDIELVQGEGRFQVAKDPTRPFIVTAQEAEVRALGTVFNIRIGEHEAQVAVIEGHVAVDQIGDVIERPVARTTATAVASVAPLRHVELQAGERAVVSASGVTPGAGQPLDVVNAWAARQYTFRDETLSSVLAEFNRSRTRPLVLDDPELGAMRISGVFSVEDPDSMLAYLRGLGTIAITEDADGTAHLRRVHGGTPE